LYSFEKALNASSIHARGKIIFISFTILVEDDLTRKNLEKTQINSNTKEYNYREFPVSKIKKSIQKISDPYVIGMN
jgi:hypothetical protein